MIPPETQNSDLEENVKDESRSTKSKTPRKGFMKEEVGDLYLLRNNTSSRGRGKRQRKGSNLVKR